MNIFEDKEKNLHKNSLIIEKFSGMCKCDKLHYNIESVIDLTFTFDSNNNKCLVKVNDDQDRVHIKNAAQNVHFISKICMLFVFQCDRFDKLTRKY